MQPQLLIGQDDDGWEHVALDDGSKEEDGSQTDELGLHEDHSHPDVAIVDHHGQVGQQLSCLVLVCSMPMPMV